MKFQDEQVNKHQPFHFLKVLVVFDDLIKMNCGLGIAPF